MLTHPTVPDIAVFDRSAAVRRGVRAVLEEAGYRVSEHDPHDLPASIRAAAIVATVESGGDVAHLARIRSVAPEACLLVLAQGVEFTTVIQAVRSGSTAVLPWNARPEIIVSALGSALDGLATLPAHIVADLASRVRASTASLLDQREAEWLQYLASGKTVAALADKVGYSEREMFRTLAELYHRLGASNRSEALVKATQLGMLGDAVD